MVSGAMHCIILGSSPGSAASLLSNRRQVPAPLHFIFPSVSTGIRCEMLSELIKKQHLTLKYSCWWRSTLGKLFPEQYSPCWTPHERSIQSLAEIH